MANPGSGKPKPAFFIAVLLVKPEGLFGRRTSEKV